MNIVTNNIKVYEYYKDKAQPVSFIEGGYRDVLCAVRDQVHKGSVLMTHPLSGSVKPNETKFKSIALSTKEDYEVDFDSLSLIENSIVTFDKFSSQENRLGKLEYTNEILEDFRTVDFSLLVNSLDRGGGCRE